METFYHIKPDIPPPPKRLLFYGRKRALDQGGISVIRVTTLGDISIDDEVEAVTEHWELVYPIALPGCQRIQITDIREESLRTLFENPSYAMEELLLEGMPEHMTIAERISELLRVNPSLGMDSPLFRVEFRRIAEAAA